MSDDLKVLNEKAVLRLWPETGKILRLTKGATYRAAMSGEIETVRFGRLMRVPTAWIKRKLGLEDAAA
jgi:hypothetical protein